MGGITTNPEWTVLGKYVVITGATSGIGLAAAKALAARGAKLGIVARNQNKANDIVTQIKDSTNGSFTLLKSGRKRCDVKRKIT